jgi:Protein of unknown function (DUF1778)
MATGSGQRDLRVELGTDRISFLIKQQEWERFIEVLDRPPRDNPGIEKLFSKPGVFRLRADAE